MRRVVVFTLLLIAAFIASGYLLPGQVHVERATTIGRPVGMVFELLNGYSHYTEWSPWVGRDPEAVFEPSGPGSGVGARLSWTGDPQLVGSGWQEIVASKPNERIDILLDFDAQGVADTGFILEPVGEGTRVTWFFDSDLTKGVNALDSLLARYFGLLFERWVGDDYELGLANLKRYAESLPVARFRPPGIERVEVEARGILFVETVSSQDPADIAEAMAAAYAEVSDFMRASGIEMSGQPMAITRAWREGAYRFDAAIPVDRLPAALAGNVQSGLSPSGPAVRAVHRGGYDQMMPTYRKLEAYMSAHGLAAGTVSWEHYISDPAKTPRDELVTHVYIMLEPAAGAD